MSTAQSIIADQVRERVRRDGVDLRGSRELTQRYVNDEIRRYSERALGGVLPLLPDETLAAREIAAALTGFGPLQHLLDDPEVEEIWINGPDKVFAARGGVSKRTGIQLPDAQVRDLVERMLQSSGRRVDLSSPFVDAALPDGSRLHV
ncbi:MAG: CpaF family protein, partial [Microbacteriaceae bacterium]